MTPSVGPKAIAFYVVIGLIFVLAMLAIYLKTSIDTALDKLADLGMTYIFGQSAVDTMHHFRNNSSDGLPKSDGKTE